MFHARAHNNFVIEEVLTGKLAGNAVFPGYNLMPMYHLWLISEPHCAFSISCQDLPYYYPARACASKGLCDRSWCLLYIYILLYICKDFFYLSKYSLSDAHFSTGRLLFEFNRLQYTLAAPEVFVSSANPVILPSGYRVSIVRNTNIDQIETTPLRYCMLHG